MWVRILFRFAASALPLVLFNVLHNLQMGAPRCIANALTNLLWERYSRGLRFTKLFYMWALLSTFNILWCGTACCNIWHHAATLGTVKNLSYQISREFLIIWHSEVKLYKFVWMLLYIIGNVFSSIQILEKEKQMILKIKKKIKKWLN